MSVVDWYLIRHAPVQNSGREAGQNLYRSADEPADLSDAVKLDRLAAQLPDEAQWLASPLKRTMTTAEALLSRKECTREIGMDDRLIEQDFGDWFGLSFDQLWQEIKHLPPHNWSLLAAESCPPNGESFQQVWDRVGAFMAENIPQKDDQPRIIVSHAGVIRAMIGHTLGLSPDNAASFALDPLSLTHLQYSDQDYLGGHWRLVKMNQIFGE